MARNPEQERKLLSAARKALGELRDFYDASRPPARSRRRIAHKALVLLDFIKAVP